MSKDDDEVTVDFSKIGKFFSGKDKKEHKDGDEHHKHDDADHHKDHESHDHDSHKTSEHESHREHKHNHHVHKNHHKSESHEHRSKRDQDEEELDLSQMWKSTKSFMKKHSVLFLLLIPIILSVFLRIMPVYLPVTDDWAQNTVRQNMQSDIASQVNSQYPNLPQQNKQKLINEEMNKQIQQNPELYQDAIEQASNFYKSQLKDDNGQTYMLAIDPYYWVYFAKNILENGHTGDTLKDGRPWTYKQQAPIGGSVKPELHMYTDAYFYKFINLFTDADIWTTTFYIPVILAALGVIPAFFLARKRGGDLAGLVAAIFVAIHPAFLSRTAAGFADTDAYNVTLPLFIMWFFIEAFEAKDTKRSALLMLASSIMLGIFKFAWSGWWYIYDFVLATIFVYLGFLVLRYFSVLRKDLKAFFKKEEVRSSLMKVGMFIAFSLFVLAFSGRGGLNTVFQGLIDMPQHIIELKEVATKDIWPNVFTTVAELNPSSIKQTIQNVGGKLVFLASLVGILFSLSNFMKKDVPKKQRHEEVLFVSVSTIFYMFLVANPERFSNFIFLVLMGLPIAIRFIMLAMKPELKVDIKYATLLIIWFAGTIFGSTRGIRFVMLLVPAFSVAIGLFVGIFYDLAVKLSKKHLKINEFISVPVLLVLVYVLLLATPWQNALATAKGEVPSMNDAWWNGLKEIQKDSQDDAIITSWWDFGHWFRAVADRGVNFDGATQNTPQAHWVGRALLTEDENMSLGILRMLDCGRNEAYDTLIEEKKPIEALHILDSIMPIQDKEKARDILAENDLEGDFAEKVLNYTHCQPPEGYFITSEDMVGKAGVWGHFGAWDFDKANMYFDVNKLGLEEGINTLQEEYDLSEDKAKSMYYEIQNADPDQWISPWPGYVTGLSGCRDEQDAIVCVHNVQDGQAILAFNESDKNAHILTQQGDMRPDAISYYDDDGEFVIDRYDENTVGYSFTLVKNANGKYQSVMMHPRQVGSMFTRLFFHKDEDIPYFDKFYEQRGITAGNVLIWKIDWDGKSVVDAEVEGEVQDVEVDMDNLLNKNNSLAVDVSE